MARKKTPEEEIQDLTFAIRQKLERWKKIKKEGAGDPNWPDGTNLNLVRTQIMSSQGRLRELCKRKCPREAKLKVPPEVSNTYMARRRRKKSR